MHDKRNEQARLDAQETRDVRGSRGGRVMERRSAIGIALLCAAVLFVAALVALHVLLPAQSDAPDDGRDYGYVYSGVKSSSVDFTCATAVDDAIALFGSSELSTPPSLISQVPAVGFGQQECGPDLIYIGEA